MVGTGGHHLRTALLALLASVIAVGLVAPSGASASRRAPDPPNNIKLGKLPKSCDSHPLGRSCENAAIYYLDRARKKVGLDPYALPAKFLSLSAAQQVFILANLDRTAYGLQPVAGLTKALNEASSRGVRSNEDPRWPLYSSIDSAGYGSNWAGSFQNIEIAYYNWVYADGLGTGNTSCTPSHRGGCWEHRHIVLSTIHRGYATAMGAAAGRDSSGRRGYAMLVAYAASKEFHPSFTYSWDQAVAAGAGTHRYDPGVPGAGGRASHLRVRRAFIRHGKLIVRARISRRADGDRVRVTYRARAGRRWRHHWRIRVRHGQIRLDKRLPARLQQAANAHVIVRYGGGHGLAGASARAAVG